MPKKRKAADQHFSLIFSNLDRWRELFGRLETERPTADDVRSLVMFWRLRPEIYRWMLSREVDDRTVLIDQWWRHAGDVVLEEARRVGLDCSAIARSGELCYRILAEHPELCEYESFWPDIVEDLKEQMKSDNRKVIDDAEAILVNLEAQVRLETRSDIEPTVGQTAGGDKDAPPRKANRRGAPRVRKPKMDREIAELWFEKSGKGGLNRYEKLIPELSKNQQAYIESLPGRQYVTGHEIELCIKNDKRAQDRNAPPTK